MFNKCIEEINDLSPIQTSLRVATRMWSKNIPMVFRNQGGIHRGCTEKLLLET